MDSPDYQEIVKNLMTNPDSEDLTRTGRITNGSPAVLGQFPYQVYMYMYTPDGTRYLCGGSVN